MKIFTSPELPSSVIGYEQCAFDISFLEVKLRGFN